MHKKWKTITLILILLFTLVIIYSPHFTYPYPLHIDEWQHIARIRYLEETIPHDLKGYFSQQKLIGNPGFEHMRGEQDLPQDWIIYAFDEAPGHAFSYPEFGRKEDAIAPSQAHLVSRLLSIQNDLWGKALVFNFNVNDKKISDIGLSSRSFSLPQGEYNLTMHYKTTEDFIGSLFLEIGLQLPANKTNMTFPGWRVFNKSEFHTIDNYLSKEFVYLPPRWNEISPNQTHFSLQPLREGWTQLTLSPIYVPFDTLAYIAVNGYCPHPPCQGQALIDQFSLHPTSHPPLPFNRFFEHPYFTPHFRQSNLEIGFYFSLWIFYHATKLDPILTWQYLPALFAMLSAFTLFLLVQSLTKRFLTGITAIILFAALPSNINILGLWFFTPLTMALPLLFLSFYLFVKLLEKKTPRAVLFFLISLSLLALIHPLSALFVLLSLFCYILLHLKKIQLPAKTILILSLVPSLFLLFLFLLEWRGSVNIIDFIKSFFIFRKGWGKFEYLYFIPQLYGIVSLLLAFLGIYKVLKSAHQRILLPGVFIAASITFFFSLTNVSIFLPYQRTIYYLLVSLVPLSAIGLISIARFIKNYTKTGAILLIILLLAINFYGYGKQEKGLELYHVIDGADYKALQFLKEYHQKEIRTVLASPLFSTAVYPIAQKSAILLLSGTVEGREFEPLLNFPFKDCQTMKNLTREYRIDSIYLRGYSIPCQEFERIYHDKEITIYLV